MEYGPKTSAFLLMWMSIYERRFLSLPRIRADFGRSCNGSFACFFGGTNRFAPDFTPLRCVTRVTGNPVYFSDPQWTNYRCLFYGLGMP
jgi:hypothetical protein